MDAVQPPGSCGGRLLVTGHAAFCFAMLMAALMLRVTDAVAANTANSRMAPILSGAEPDYPPYSVVTPDNQADGFSVELLQAALKAVGREVVFKTGPWAVIKQELVDGKLEVLPLVGRTPEREALYDFTIPYLTLHGALFIRKDTADIRTWTDLKGKRVAVMRGDNAEEYVRRVRLSDHIIAPPSFADAFQMLAKGQADAVIAQKLMGVSLLKHMGISSIHVVGGPSEEFKQSFCFAVQDGNKELLSLLNEGLAIVIAEGTKRHLENKWLGTDARAAALARVIIYGGDHAFPPYEFLDAKGRPAGFNIDLAHAVARKIGVEMSFQLGPWSEIRRKIESGELDMATMFYSAARERLVEFSVPHTLVYQAVFAHSDSPTYRHIDDLKDRRIAVQLEDIMHDYALEHGLGNLLTVTATSEDALALLAQERVDYAMGAHLQGRYWIRKHGWNHLRAVDTRLLGTDYCYVVVKGNTALRDLFNDGLRQLKDTGEYRTIYNQWLGVLHPDFARKRITMNMLLMLGAASLAAAIAFAVIFGLRRQVANRTRDLAIEKAFLDRIINAIADPVFVKDDARRFVLVNDAFCEMIGHTRENLVGGDDDYLLPKEQVDVFREADAAVLATDRKHISEESLCNASTGAVRTVVTHKSCYKAKNGKRFIVGVIRDITERKLAEKVLRQSEERFQHVTEIAGEWIWEVDVAGFYRYSNSAVKTILGYTPSELVGRKHFYDLFAPDVREGLKADLFASMAEKASFRKFENRCLHKNGTTVILETSAAPILDERGGLLGYRGTDADISERKRLEAQLRQQQNLISTGTLARGMAHEINNPLNGIMNYADLIKERVTENATLVEYADEIITGGQRVARITHSLLGFTEHQSDQAFVNAAPADMVAAVLPQAAVSAQAQGIALSCDIPADLPPVSCRRSQIEQVVTALLANAMEAWEQKTLDAASPGAMPGKRLGGGDKKIVIRAFVVADCSLQIGGDEDGSCGSQSKIGNLKSKIRLTVADNGPGIPAAIRERVFDPFFSTKDRTRHSGLGLWISRSIIHEHGGEINLESPTTALRAGEAGQWTRVHIDLPAVSADGKS